MEYIMAAEKLIAKLNNVIAQSQAKKVTLSRYAAPRRDDVLHDGMVGSGETWGGILGATLGGIGEKSSAVCREPSRGRWRSERVDRSPAGGRPMALTARGNSSERSCRIPRTGRSMRQAQSCW